MGGSPNNLIVAIIAFVGAAFIICILIIALSIHVASGHEWYPTECCASRDCHEADKVVYKNGLVIVNVGEDVITVGKGVQWRPSPDSKYHICYTKAYDAPHVYCFFVPGDA